MVSAFDLWLPILLSGALVFVASSVIHMVLPYHRKDFGGAPGEDGIMDALRGVPPGDYFVPHAGSPEAMRSDEYREKVLAGPAAFMTVLSPERLKSMRGQLTQWFVYCVVVSLFAAYVTGLAAGSGAGYMEVFRLSSTTAFVGYALAHPQRSIWYAQSWATTGRNILDGLVYGLLTGGAFGWLWP